MERINYFQAKIDATMSPMDYMNAVKENPEKYILVDVRNAPPHIMKVKIQGSVLLPLSQLQERMAELPKNKTIVLYCWDVWCNMASHAAVVLLKNGYDVKELAGGIAAWQSMNLPVEQL